MDAAAVDASRSGMLTKTAANGAGSCRALVVPGAVRLRTPTTDRWVGAFEGVVAERVAVNTLGGTVETKVSLCPEGS